MARGSVDQIAGGGHRGRDGRAVRALLLGVLALAKHRDLAQPSVFRRGLAAAEGVEPVAAQDQPFDRGRRRRRPFAGQLGQRGDRRLGTAQRACRHTGGATDRVGRPLVRALPRPIVSTLATGSDGTTSRCTCSLPPVAPSASQDRPRFRRPHRRAGTARPPRQRTWALGRFVVAGRDDRHDQYRRTRGAFGQRGGDVDGGGSGNPVRWSRAYPSHRAGT